MPARPPVGRRQRLRGAAERAAAGATRRLDGTAVELVEHPGITVVPPGAVDPPRASPSRSSRRTTASGRGRLARVLRPAAAARLARRDRRPASSPGCPRSAEVSRAPERMPGGESEGLERLNVGRRARWSTTANGTTTSRPTTPRGSRPTCTSAASRRSRSPPGWTAGRAPRRSCASSPGATSTTRCSPPGRRPRTRTTAHATTSGGPTTTTSTRGARAAPGTRWSTRRCASCARGLRAQPGPDGRRVVPHQGPLPRLATRGGATSWTTSSTATWPTTS